MECGSGVNWRVRMKGSADHFHWESVRYELETGSRMLVMLNVTKCGNK